MYLLRIKNFFVARCDEQSIVDHSSLGQSFNKKTNQSQESVEELEGISCQHTDDRSSSIVSSLKLAGINLVCIDFDNTLVSKHTNGNWPGSAEELADHVQPLFRQLVPACINNGIFVAIVTFSPQTSLISQVLQLQYGDSVASAVPVIGLDGSWVLGRVGSIEFRSHSSYVLLLSVIGKSLHISRATDSVKRVAPIGTRIEEETILLIDDDFNNVCAAKANGIKAVQYRNHLVSLSVQELISLKS